MTTESAAAQPNGTHVTSYPKDVRDEDMRRGRRIAHVRDGPDDVDVIECPNNA